MAVVPLRRDQPDIEIEDAPRPDMRVATIRIGEGGELVRVGSGRVRG